VWPVNNKGLQLRAALVGVCLLVSNVLNLLIPRQLGIVIDSLDNANHSNPWAQVLVLAALKLLDSQAGITLLRQWLWLPVEYYSEQAMAVAAYSHVLNLSSDFHDSKSSSDIMTAISAGSSISDMLESLCFRAVPMFIDFAVALTYLSVTFGPYEGFITIATATMFIHVASYTIVALKEPRRTYVSTWYKEHYVQQAGIQGWSTVACFNQIGYEEDRYREVSQDKADKTMAINIMYYLAYALQYLTTLCGLLAGLLLAVHQVTTGRATSGQFIMLLTYWNQLVSPLSYFATLGKTISKNLIQAERLLEIMQTKATVVSKEGAPKFDFKGGRVQLKAVGFSYDNKKDILKDVTMDVAPGTTVAFVGQTGAGKSTILKLLDRFYDVTEGAIEIDGQDIRDVDLSR
jgi:ABC-type transport system involved in Fe-S cluster assembly fused permease/ATPase subunit